jgi:hypothetical protein
MKLTICPCCGFKFEGELSVGCTACGARSVGPPLARPEHELPAFGRSLFVSATGGLLLLSFLASTAFALYERSPFSLDFWNVVASAETAAWRLKWLGLALTPFVLWAGWRLTASIRRAPTRFAGVRLAHGGLTASAVVAVLLLTLIGVTVPERLRQRRLGIEASYYAQGHTVHRALLEYRARYGTLPTDPKDLLERLPDTDGSIAAALQGIEAFGYKPTVDLASLPKPKSSKTRNNGSAYRRVSIETTTDDSPAEGVSFTNYEMRLPGEDKLLGTEDDWLVRDGVILKPSQFPRQDSPTLRATGKP